MDVRINLGMNVQAPGPQARESGSKGVMSEENCLSWSPNGEDNEVGLLTNSQVSCLRSQRVQLIFRVHKVL